MIGMILVTHGHLAEEFVHAMEHVVGQQSDVATVCIGPHDDMEARRKVIAGINLPMLIRLAGARKDMDLAAAAAAARDAGRNYITIASEFLGQDA